MKKSENKPFILLALIATTAIVDSISGSVRSTVFAKNKGGAYIRGKGTVLNPNTALQSGVRSIFTLISQKWSALSESQRNSWNGKTTDFPYQNRLGQQRELTGKALFQKLNNNLLNIGQDLIETAPLPASVIGFTAVYKPFEINTTAETIVFGVNFDGAPEKSAIIMEATPPLSPGVTNAENQFRKVAVIGSGDLANNDSVNSSDFDTTAQTTYEQLVHRFGTPAVGEKIFIRFKAVNIVTGQAGTYFKTSGIAS